MVRLQFELHVRPLDDGTYACELHELPPADTRPHLGDQRKRKVSSISGLHLLVVEPAIKRAIKANGYKAAELRRSRRTPFKISEDDGIRLDLTFRAVRDLQKRTKAEEIVQGITAMSREEVLYWHSKVSLERTRQNGLKALRILLGGE